MPPILILLDSSHTRIRTRATVILSNILERIDESILAKTGLTEVIWSAIFPNLTSLPPITNLEDSVALLRVTYPALITLAKLWHPSLHKRIPLLDRVVREGVIYAMLFSGVKLKVVEVELESLESLIYEMSIYFVKHLKVDYFGVLLILAHYPNRLIYPRKSPRKQSSATTPPRSPSPRSNTTYLLAKNSFPPRGNHFAERQHVGDTSVIKMPPSSLPSAFLSNV